jgi:hypothetical protein
MDARQEGQEGITQRDGIARVGAEGLEILRWMGHLRIKLILDFGQMWSCGRARAWVDQSGPSASLEGEGRTVFCSLLPLKCRDTVSVRKVRQVDTQGKGFVRSLGGVIAKGAVCAASGRRSSQPVDQ